jgi:hypothetical protein
VKSNLRFCWRQCRSTGASAIGGDTLEPWQDVWDASPHTGGGGGGPAQHHTVGSPGEPPGRWVPLLVARAGWLLARADCSQFLIPFVAPHRRLQRREGTEVVVMAHAVEEAEATR